MRTTVDTLHDSAHKMLGLLSEAFSLYPLPGIDAPTPSEEGAFLTANPQYLNGGYYRLTANTFAEERSSFDGLSPERQHLAASLIAATLDENELLEIAGRQL